MCHEYPTVKRGLPEDVLDKEEYRFGDDYPALDAEDRQITCSHCYGTPPLVVVVEQYFSGRVFITLGRRVFNGSAWEWVLAGGAFGDVLAWRTFDFAPIPTAKQHEQWKADDWEDFLDEERGARHDR